jgi:diguanylate cyclase (GGDEF)-like protein
MVQKSRTGDLISRWGGEEFLLVLPETDLQQAYTLAERIRVEAEARTLITRHGKIRISASLGVAERKRQATLDELIAEADIQLYEAKRSGRNKVCPVFELDIAQTTADQAPV